MSAETKPSKRRLDLSQQITDWTGKQFQIREEGQKDDSGMILRHIVLAYLTDCPAIQVCRKLDGSDDGLIDTTRTENQRAHFLCGKLFASQTGYLDMTTEEHDLLRKLVYSNQIKIQITDQIGRYMGEKVVPKFGNNTIQQRVLKMVLDAPVVEAIDKPTSKSVPVAAEAKP